MTDKWGANAPEHHRTGLWFFDPETGVVGEQVFLNAQAGVMTLRQPNGEEVVVSSTTLQMLTKDAQDAYNSGLQDARNDCEYIEPDEFGNIYRRGYRHGILSAQVFERLDVV